MTKRSNDKNRQDDLSFKRKVIVSRELLSILIFFFAGIGMTHAQPVFVSGHDPKPPGKVWTRVSHMSDEFEGSSLDTAKWQSKPVANGWTWDGRPPALFKADNVMIKEGKMRVTVGKLDEPVVKNGKTFTHQGAIVRSLKAGHVGWYFECKMKANKTVMSSTFWLMTKNNSKKKLELDIQECVGRTTDKTETWAKHWDQIFHSNAIHRTNRYNRQKVQLQRQVKTETKNSERFYVYGAWWKSSDEICFYLDGKYCYSIRPKVEWDVPAYIQMAIETYSWNPMPDDRGLVESGSWEERTTQYEWVRTWKLETAATASPERYPSESKSPKKQLLIPKQANEYVWIYKPSGDYFFGPDTKHLKEGQWYDDWVPNDHTFVKDENGKWYIMGITHPLVESNPLKEGIHEGEFASFHAVSSATNFKETLKEHHYSDLPKILPPKERPAEPLANHAPYIIKKDGLYYMIYGPSPLRLAVSSDLSKWDLKGNLFHESDGARDPGLLLHNGTYYVVYCSVKSVRLRKSKDLIHWSEPETIFTSTGFDPESPSLIYFNKSLYLFVCSWDGNWDGKDIQGAYQHITYVYHSKDTLNFGIDDEKQITTLNSHAPEIFRDEDGKWYISSVEWPYRGVSVDMLKWEEQHE